MNNTKDAFPLSVLGAFAPSGFFKKAAVQANQPAQAVYRKHYEAATPAQTARLGEVFGRKLSSHLRF